MELNFNWKYKDYELRSVPKSLARLNNKEKNHTIELIKWSKSSKGEYYCFTIAYWKLTREGYVLTMIGDRIFADIRDDDFMMIWTQMKSVQEILDDFDLDNVFEEFMELDI